MTEIKHKKTSILEAYPVLKTKHKACKSHSQVIFLSGISTVESMQN